MHQLYEIHNGTIISNHANEVVVLTFDLQQILLLNTPEYNEIILNAPHINCTTLNF